MAGLAAARRTTADIGEIQQALHYMVAVGASQDNSPARKNPETRWRSRKS
jgi:DNA-binding FadR family transcriptional regulator